MAMLRFIPPHGESCHIVAGQNSADAAATPSFALPTRGVQKADRLDCGSAYFTTTWEGGA
jgi:hypothetical protein